MLMHVIATELGLDWAGPYTDPAPNPRLQAALERKIAESEKEDHSKMDDAEDIFSHISEDLLPQLTDRQLTNLIELIRAAQVERETERILSSVRA